MSVLIPARNEAERIGTSVEGWARQDYPDYEVLVYDDESTDGTAARALAAAGGAAHVRVLRGEGLPRGWRGKAWACHRLGQAATGEVLVFADADIEPAPDVLRRTAGALAGLGAAAVSAVPAHRGGSRVVGVLAGLQNWAALTFVPAWLPPARRPGWLAATTGQFLALRAPAYDAVGGFAAVAGSLAEDVSLGRRLAGRGHALRLLDGAGGLRCRPYATAGALWRASARNLLPVFFDSPALLLAALTALAAVHLAPAVLLVLGAAVGGGGTWAWTGLPLVELGLAVLGRLISDRRAGYPWWHCLLHPATAALLLPMGLDSVVRFRIRRVVEWRDRRYEDLAA